MGSAKQRDSHRRPDGHPGRPKTKHRNTKKDLQVHIPDHRRETTRHSVTTSARAGRRHAVPVGWRWQAQLGVGPWVL